MPLICISLTVNHFPIVIGRGGEQISRIQQDSGCKIQIAPGELTLCPCNSYFKMLKALA